MPAALDLARDMARPAVRSMLLGSTALTRFGVNGVEAALALDFIGGEYRTANTATTFADAFTGNSPKLTYSTAAGSNSTMVNSAGEIVWAPHNLMRYSEDFSQWSDVNSAGGTVDTGYTDPSGGTNAALISSPAGVSFFSNGTNITTSLGANFTISMWVKSAGLGNDTFRLIFDGGVISSDLTATSEWQLFEFTGVSDGSGSAGIARDASNNAMDLYIYGAHLYRSDLGGMAQVPQSATGFEYYVPTNGNPEYLPRVGHHVYNGTTWVNEGLLIESELRTNLVPYSNSNWVTMSGGTIDENNATGPDGETSATLYTTPAETGVFGARTNAYSTSTGTLSCYLKSNGVEIVSLWHSDGNAGRAVFNLLTGEASAPVALDGYGIEDAGNGWWRCFIYSSAYTTQSVRIYAGDGSSTTYNGTDGFYVYGAQHETAPTPSSYMPTSGGTYTRTAQSLTVPPAQFGWPEPEYIGPELVTNGTFDADTSGWSLADPTYGSISHSSGKIRLTQDVSGSGAIATQAINTVVGKVYNYSVDFAVDATTGNNFIYVGTSIGGTQTVNVNVGSVVGTYSGTFVATSTTHYISVGNSSATLVSEYSEWDNISVREINPLSVSIQMDGRMTYADDGASQSQAGKVGTAVFYTHWASSSDYVEGVLSTSGVRTGSFVAQSEEASSGDDRVLSAETTYSPGILTPFNIASRHGSTFINGAVDGVALPGDTTPTALPDLSGTDLQIAYDFMGTIGQFRQFAGDIGDTGLVTATNPSTEPTLSLTFNGTGGSFYNLNWSE